MTPISTGYQPEFGLGALYQGFNAANADRLNEEEVLKHFLQNQKDIREAPLNQIIKQWEAKQAEGKMGDPEYLAKMMEGYKGQMNSQIAAGNKGMRTWESDADATVQENKNKLFMGKTLEDWNKLRLEQQIQQSQEDQEPTATINRIPDQWGGEGLQKGSPITWSGPWGGNTNKANALSAFTGWRGGALGDISKQSNMVKSFGSDYRNAPDMPSANYMINEINRGLANPNIKPKDKQDLLKEKQRILAELNGQPPVLSNMMQQPQEAPVSPQNNVLAQLQNVLVNTPEHLQKMALLNARGENALELVGKRNEGMLASAMKRVNKDKPLNIDQTIAKASRILAGIEEGDKDAARIIIEELRDYKLSTNPQAYNGTQMNIPATQRTGEITNFPNALEQSRAGRSNRMLTGDSTRRKEAQEQRGVATGQVSSGNKFKVERTD